MSAAIKITQRTLNICFSVFLFLLATALFLNQGYVFQTLNIGIIATFGIVGLWLFNIFCVLYGFYLLFKPLIKYNFNLCFIGYVFIFVGLLILITAIYNFQSSEMRPSNFLTYFMNAWDKGKTPTHNGTYFKVSILYGEIAGGWLGYLLSSLLFFMTPIGCLVVSSIIIFVGLVLLFNIPISLLIRKSNKKIVINRKKKNKKTFYERDDEIDFETKPNKDDKKIIEPTIIKNEASEFDVDPDDEFNTELYAAEGLRPINFSLDELNDVEAPAPQNDNSININLNESLNEDNKENISDDFDDDSDYETSLEKSSEEFIETKTESKEEEKDDFFEGLGIEQTPSQNQVFEEPKVTSKEETLSPLFSDEEKESFLYNNNSNASDLSKNLNQPMAKFKPSYTCPDSYLLDEITYDANFEDNERKCIEREAIINKTFNDLRIGASVVGHTIGPSITRYDIEIKEGHSVNEITRYVNDLSMKLGGISARFEAIVKGKTTSGLEVPNQKTSLVKFKELFEALPSSERVPLAVPFGKDITGNCISGNVGEFPHMLVAGSTGSGKSIFVHSLILSLIMRNRPDELKFVMIDPKRVEFAKYRDIPFLLTPIITESPKAKVAIQKLIDEMERRYTLFEKTLTSKISQFNEYAKENGLEQLPYIICFVDEYADLSEQCKGLSDLIVRIAQKARAAGIHLVIATQRPDVKVITGTIKANLGTRVSLSVASSVDSITVLGQMGAEKLLGYGDMLVDCQSVSRVGLTRCQGCFVSNQEIERVVTYIKDNFETKYDPYFLDLEENVSNDLDNKELSKTEIREQQNQGLYEIVREATFTTDFTSISRISRDFSIGPSRAGKIFSQLQRDGIVDKQAASSSKGCKVLIHSMEEYEKAASAAK